MQAIRLLGASLRIQLLAWIFPTLIGAICINLYRSFLTANTTANPYLRPDIDGFGAGHCR